jgi:hypothetical protein
MTWHFGDTPDTPCFGAPLRFFDATGLSLLTYDRVAREEQRAEGAV